MGSGAALWAEMVSQVALWLDIFNPPGYLFRVKTGYLLSVFQEVIATEYVFLGASQQ